MPFSGENVAHLVLVDLLRTPDPFNGEHEPALAERAGVRDVDVTAKVDDKVPGAAEPGVLHGRAVDVVHGNVEGDAFFIVRAARNSAASHAM